MKRVHLFISGQVQGVFFRAYTQAEAKKLGLSGWVKNTNDNRVETVFEGQKAALDKIIQWCHLGSPSAKVEKVEVVWEKAEGLEGFEIRY